MARRGLLLFLLFTLLAFISVVESVTESSNDEAIRRVCYNCATFIGQNDQCETMMPAETKVEFVTLCYRGQLCVRYVKNFYGRKLMLFRECANENLCRANQSQFVADTCSVCDRDFCNSSKKLLASESVFLWPVLLTVVIWIK